MANETAWKRIGPPEFEISELHPEVLDRESSDESLRLRLEELGDQIARLNIEREEIKRRLRLSACCSYCGSAPVYAKGLCKNCYVRALRNGDPVPKKRGRKATSLREPPKPDIPWRLRFAYEVCQKSFPPPEDLDETVDFAIRTLQMRFRMLIHYRYEQKMTLEECGLQIGVGKERARQLISRAKSSLRNRSDFGVDFFICGKSVFDAKKEEVQIRKQKSLSNAITANYAVPIDELNLSNRAGRVLLIAGLDTVGKALEYSQLQMQPFLACRNCGIKTAMEIVDALSPLVEEGEANDNM